MTRLSFTSVFLMAAMPALPCLIADDDKDKLPAFLEEIDLLVEDGDVVPAVEKIQSQENPSEVIRQYFAVTNHFYRSRRDVGKMLAIGQAAMKYSMDQAAKEPDTELSEKWKGFAKSMAYNLSVNAWPGWNEPEITITRDQSMTALEIARENLRLAIELERPADVLGNAYWLLGAQHLALEQPDEAIAQFKKAVDEFSTGKKYDYQYMAEGYIGIAQRTQSDAREAGQETLERALDKLASRTTSDAKFFSNQLKSVSELFAPDPPES